MTWNGNMTDIASVIAYLTNLQKETNDDVFTERLDRINCFYRDHMPYLGKTFIEYVKPLAESWHKTQMRFLIEAELNKLLDSYLFDEADECYKKNIDYVDESWYVNSVSLKVNDKLTALLNQFYQLQKNGTERILWNQDYSQRKYDDELISLVSKYILEIREVLYQLNTNRDILINQQKDTIDLSRKHITELGYILEHEAENEKDSLKALNATWETILPLQGIITPLKSILTDIDSKLILKWSQPDVPSTYKGKAMTSAREAEIAAYKLYCDIYGNAEDISILQVTSPKDDRWKYADIATDGRWIDVKNARTSYSSPNSYSEHCVPQFKLDRNKRDVSISSFLSPYCNDTQSIIWLGETTIGEIEKLQNEFNSQYLEVTFTTHLNNSFLPAWLFDYPSVCYIDRNAALAVIRSPEFIFPRRECDIASGILANRVIYSKTEGTLGLEAMKLEGRIKKCGLNRAVLFLHVLDRFCHVSSNNNTFKCTELDKILFPSTEANKEAPLGVLDPLETVWNLWNVLLAVSEKCLKETKCFTMFRLRRANILQGRNHDGSWSTVYAYCGGWLRLNDGTSVRCGQNPIYLGQDAPCRSCGYLICHRCGFCSIQCPDCKNRQDHWIPKIDDYWS
jgi:hypothetical protein